MSAIVAVTLPSTILPAEAISGSEAMHALSRQSKGPEFLPLSEAAPFSLSLQGLSSQALSSRDTQAVLSLLETMQAAATVLSDDLERASLYAKIAVAYDAWGERETAIALIDQANDIRQKTIDEPSLWLTTAIAQAALQVGRSEYAIELLPLAMAQIDANIEDVLNHPGQVDEDRIGWDLKRVVEVAAQMTDYPTAETILNAALERLAEPLEEHSKKRVLKAVVEVVDPWPEAVAARILLQVHRKIEAIAPPLTGDSDDWSRSALSYDLGEIQVAIASTAASFDDPNQAIPILNALQTSTVVAYPIVRGNVLTAIASAYRELGASQSAVATLTDTFNLVQSMSDDSHRLHVLSSMISVTNDLGDQEWRNELFTLGLDIAQTLLDNDETSTPSIQRLAGVAVQFQDDQQTTEALQSLLPVATALSRDGTRSLALEHIARASASLSNDANTAQILNAIIPFIEPMTDDYSREELVSAIVTLALDLSHRKGSRILQQIAQIKRNADWVVYSPPDLDPFAEWNRTTLADPTGWVDTILNLVQDVDDHPDPIARLQSLRTLSQFLPATESKALALLLVAQGYKTQEALDEMAVVLQAVMVLANALPNEHPVKPHIMGTTMAMASGLNDEGLATSMIDDAITYGAALATDELTPNELTPNELTPNELTPNELMPNELTPDAFTTDDRKAQFIQAVAGGMPQWQHSSAIAIPSMLVSMGQTIQNPHLRVKALMAIASVYIDLDAAIERDANHNPAIIDLLEQAYALVPNVTDDGYQQSQMRLAIAQYYANSENRPQAEAILDSLYRSSTEAQDLENDEALFALAQMLQGAIAIDAMDHAAKAMASIITTADTLPRETVRRKMALLDASALEWEFQTSDPEEQLDRYWNKLKTDLFIGIARIILETQSVAEAHPQLASTLESAIPATDSITIADEQFYALRAIGMAAIRTQNTAQVIAAFTRAVSTFDNLDAVYDPMESCIEALNEYDVPTSTYILSQVVEGMDNESVTDYSKIEGMWAIATYLTELSGSD